MLGTNKLFYIYIVFRDNNNTLLVQHSNAANASLSNYNAYCQPSMEGFYMDFSTLLDKIIYIYIYINM